MSMTEEIDRAEDTRISQSITLEENVNKKM